MLAGCGGVKVGVDARLVKDSGLWHHLDGPTYRVLAPAPEMESSLEFQDFADLLAAALQEPRPNLRRLGGPGTLPALEAAALPPRESSPAMSVPRPDLYLTLDFQIFDRGTATGSYPLYGTRRTTLYGPYGRRRSYYGSFYAGQAFETYHLGFVHTATLVAWTTDTTQPAGRRVIWEGRADLLREDPEPCDSMPYLAIALATCYGQPTEGRAVLKFKRGDDRVEALRTKSH